MAEKQKCLFLQDPGLKVFRYVTNDPKNAIFLLRNAFFALLKNPWAAFWKKVTVSRAGALNEIASNHNACC